MDMSEYLGLSCEVQNVTSRLLAKGEIVRTEDGLIEIVDRYDSLPILRFRTSVKVVINADDGLRVLVGYVTNSDRNLMQIKGLMSLADFEKRAYFRVVVERPADFYPIDHEADPERDFDQINVANITKGLLVNISLSGALIETDYKMDVGDRLYLEVNTMRRMLLLKCVVRRKQIMPESKKRQYGCEFVENRGRDIDSLCTELFRLQAIEIAKNKEMVSP